MSFRICVIAMTVLTVLQSIPALAGYRKPLKCTSYTYITGTTVTTCR